VTIGGQPVEIAADALRGPRWNLKRAIRFDSDGTFNDADPDPVVVESGEVMFALDQNELWSVANQDLGGKIVLVNYAAVDRSILGTQTAVENAWALAAANPAGIVLVTQYSNVPGESHGAFVGDENPFNWVEAPSNPPVLYARIEDMAEAGITGWDDLAAVEGARMVWDVDVFSPGTSGNLIARIPGQDSSRAVILGGHIDSPNSPGAMDDGSGSAVLLEVARVINEAEMQPATDVYLVWYGSEETGLYGSAYFVMTHQEVLDRALAVLNVDCLTHPLDGITPTLALNTWSFGRFGDDRILWPEYLANHAAALGIQTKQVDRFELEADNSSYAGFGVPHANLIYEDYDTMEALGGVHYAAHLHDPYDTVDLVRLEQDVLVDMARIAVIAALRTGEEQPVLRVAPDATRRAVLVGSHTETANFSPMLYTDFGMALLMQGLDVDLIPYGETLTAEALDNAAVVIVLPSADYPDAASDLSVYDVAWTEAEVDVLEDYARSGGLLVLTNSAYYNDFVNRPATVNEDWADMNAVGARFGVTFKEELVGADRVMPESGTPFTEDVAWLAMLEANAVPFDLTEGRVLAAVGGSNVMAHIPVGDGGEVLVLGDVGMFATPYGQTPLNLGFWENLAAYAAGR
jgi:hypothetical protein